MIYCWFPFLNSTKPFMLWVNMCNMKERHEANFGSSISIGKDYFYLGISVWFCNWDIHIAISGREPNES